MEKYTELCEENEVWKAIVGYPNYLVSNHGRVKSCTRLVSCGKAKNRLRPTPEIILKPNKVRSGYLIVVLQKQPFVVHRLVAQAFIPNPKKKKQVNHKNGIKTDNTVENLEWVTAAENASHAVKTGLRSNPQRGAERWNARFTEKEIVEMRRMASTGISCKEIAAAYSTSYKVIWKIITLKTWKHIS